MTDFVTLDLDEVERAVRGDLDEARRAFGGLSPAALAWTPAPGRWSVGQCLHHLDVTDRLYLDRLESALARAVERGLHGEEPFRGTWFGRWFTRSMAPGPSRRLKTPRVFDPGEAAGLPGDVIGSFERSRERFLETLARARGVDLDRVAVASPVSRLIRFRASDAFRIMVAHDRRHLVQARRVLDTPTFPA